MRYLDRLKMGSKLALAPLLAIILLMAVAALAAVGLGRQQDAVEHLSRVRFERFKAAQANVQVTHASLRSVYRLMTWINNRYPQDKVDELGKAIGAETQALVAGLEGLASADGLDGDEKAALSAALPAARAYRKAVAEVVDIAGIDVALASTYVRKAEISYETMSKALESFSATEEALTRRAKEHVDESTAHTLGGIVVAVPLAVWLSLLFTWVIRRNILATVNEVDAAADNWRRGVLGCRAEVCAEDEIGHAARTFNGVIENFQVVVRKVADNATQVAGAARLMADGASQVAAGSRRQSEVAASAAATMESITGGVAQVAETAGQARQVAGASADAAAEGDAALRQVLDQTRHVKSTFGEIAQAVNQFVESTATIFNMTTEVKDLAEQTNLLALNAAIEAARAGDQGRGFAVVADEVRKLAERSSSAACRIDEVTRSLKERSGRVEDSLSRGTVSLSATESLFGQLESVFANIHQRVDELGRSIAAITTAVREHSDHSARVAGDIQRIAGMAGENDVASGEAARAAADLDRLAQGLHVAVAEFHA